MSFLNKLTTSVRNYVMWNKDDIKKITKMREISYLFVVKNSSLFKNNLRRFLEFQNVQTSWHIVKNNTVYDKYFIVLHHVTYWSKSRDIDEEFSSK